VENAINPVSAGRGLLNKPASQKPEEKSLSRWLAARLKGGWPAVVLTVLSHVLAAAAIIFQADLTSRVISNVFLAGSSLTEESRHLGLLFLIMTGRALMTFGSEFFAHTIAQRIKSKLRLELFDHLFRSGPSFTREEKTAELATTSLAGVESLEAYYSQYLPQLILAALIPLSVLLYVFPRDLLSGLVLLVTAPLLPFFMILIGNASERLTARRWSALGRLSHFFLDTLQGLTTLKVFSQSHAWASRLNDAGEQYRSATLNVLRVTFLSALALELLATLSTAVVAVEIGLRLLYGRLDYQPALMILLLAPEFYLPLRVLSQRYHASRSGLSAAARIVEILSHPLPTKPRTAIKKFPFNPTPIVFNTVSVNFSERNLPALQGVSFTVTRGERIAIVGGSGAGKSTLFNLLLRFLEPSSGEISIGGVNLSSIQVDTWRNHIAWVPQKPYLFNTSLGENLRLGNPDAKQSELEEACRKASLIDVITALPAGLDTLIGEGGLRLSGGQAQRLALARAFLKHADLVLLDEAGAGLDPEAALELTDTMTNIPSSTTVLAITHHLSGITAFERVLFFSEGRLTGDFPPLEYLQWCRRNPHE
jgi:ATP-binding cassette subfamily C protein CydD